jgi:hypothetical protein
MKAVDPWTSLAMDSYAAEALERAPRLNWQLEALTSPTLPVVLDSRCPLALTPRACGCRSGARFQDSKIPRC